MGVHGLWRLIEPSGKPVPLETLENKVLAVDISIWLHQAVKGFQDSKGASVPNAHLLGIYHRVCKLLYFRIKPIFVFDGGVPALKKQTIAKRTQSKLRNVSEADKIKKQLLNTLLKHTAVSKVLTEKIEASIASMPKASRTSKDDMYVLPPSDELESTISSSEDESYSESSTTDSSPTKNWDLHTIDMDSVHFKSLPVDVRHEILTDLKQTRKQSSWGRLHELPKVSDDFSIYQMRRLLKRQAVQTALEDAEKEMGGKSLSLAELESILKDQGVITNQNVGNRIASDETTKYLLVKDLKKAIDEARKKELSSNEIIGDRKEVISGDCSNDDITIAKDESLSITTEVDTEYEDDLKKAIALSLECVPSTSDVNPVQKLSQKSSHGKLNPAEVSFLENFTDADFASSSSDEEETVTKHSGSKMSSAESYMLEYSGLTPNEIAKIIKSNNTIAETKTIRLMKTNLPIVSETIHDVDLAIGKNDKCGEVKENAKDSNKYPRSDEIETIDDSVEIMSSDSSDADVVEKEHLKSINVVINPHSKFSKEDDLFADIFEAVSPKTEDSSKNISNLNASKESGPIISELNIIHNPAEKCIEKDALFSQKGYQVAPKIKDCKVLEEGSANNLPNKESHNISDISDETIPIEKRDIINASKEIAVTNAVMTSQENHGAKEHVQIGYEAEQNLNRPVKNKARNTQIQTLSEQELKELKDQLQRDKVELLNEKSTKERMAGNITDQMYQEAQELLELFGVPYLIAPMEAEAQCAFLDAIELTDGTITDDSDIWLFGGKTVYKNFFNQSKYVMEFRSENISHHFKLTREQMILLALLVGSDYTVGLQGVGPVTAMEILAAFPPSKGKLNEFNLSHHDLLSGLKEFRSWFTKDKSPGPGRSALKSKLKNVAFTENFPSLQVVEAYLDPKVETSRDAFSWSKPNAMALLQFARDKFGWTKTKTEEILDPVLKKLEESKHQKSIRDYFKTRFKVHSNEAQSKMSKRVKSAITNMGRDPSEVITEELEEEFKKPTRKKQTRKKNKTEAPEFSNNGVRKQVYNEVSDFEKSDTVKTTKKKPRNIKLDKPKKSTSEQQSAQADIVNQAEDAQKQEADCNEVPVNVDISAKIDLIRRRRKLKEAKAVVEIKKPKSTKEKKPSSQFSEGIPDDLKIDEEINLLSQIVAQSSQKVEEINRTMLEKLENMETKSVKALKLDVSSSTDIQAKPSSSSRRPVFRPTRIPRKELIPQKEKDKSMLLRNKLKAIEVYRKGKHGPGFVPKRCRNKRLSKAEAELSESSDE